MAKMGDHVFCVDIDAEKIDSLNAGEILNYEPGLENYLKRNHETGRLESTTDVAKGVDQFYSSSSPSAPTIRAQRNCCGPCMSRSLEIMTA